MLRLLQGTPTDDLAERMARLLVDETSADAAERAAALFEDQFGTPRSVGATMAARALSPLEPEATVRASIATLARGLLAGLRR